MELRTGNPRIKDLKNIGVAMEAEIFNGFKIHNPNLGRLICLRHLRRRNEETVLMLLENTNQTAVQR